MCKKEKSISEFHKHIGHKFGVGSACKECVRHRQNKDYHTSPKQKITNKKYRSSPRGKKTRQRYVQTNNYKFNRWKYWLRDKYDLTPEQYSQMLADQNSCCKICGQLETAANQYGLMRLAIDHNHNTGEIRGLLCQKCNQAIGLMNENTKVLRKAVEYLEKSK